MEESGKVVVQQSINKENKTRQDILNEANMIYAKFKKMCKERNVPTSKIKEGNYDNQLDEIYEILQKEHKDFHAAYTLQLRYMIQLGKYRSDVMDLYLRKLEAKMWTNEEEYIDYQAMYAKTLYMKSNPRYLLKEANEEYEQTKKILKNEMTQIKELTKRTMDEIEKEDKDREKRKREDMINIIKKKLVEIKKSDIENKVNS
jgi:hypothetical protein